MNLVDPTLYTCDPGRVAPTKDDQTLMIACAVKLDGFWRYESTDGLAVSSAGQNRWRIDGLGTTPVGLLKGEVQGTSAQASGFITSAIDHSVAYSVTLAATARSLHVTVSNPAVHKVFELSR